MKFALAPSFEHNDVGNQFDSDATIAELLKHNERYNRLCPSEET